MSSNLKNFINIGFDEPVAQKDTLITWRTDNQGRMTEFDIYYVPDQDSREELFYKLRDRPYCDIGNNMMGWADWKLTDVILKLFTWPCLTSAMSYDLLNQLSKVKEFSSELKRYR